MSKKGTKLSLAHKRKISESNRGRILSKESRLKISETLTGRELSEKHRTRIGIANTGKNNGRWKGGVIRKTNGYLMIYVKDHPYGDRRYIYAHRLIIEQIIGRYLEPFEQVHHLGEKDDNRPHMLIAFTSDAVHKKFYANPKSIKSLEIIFDGRKYGE